MFKLFALILLALMAGTLMAIAAWLRDIHAELEKMNEPQKEDLKEVPRPEWMDETIKI